MQRRRFLGQTLLTTGASVFTAANVFAGKRSNSYNTYGAADKPFNLNYGFHDGMFKNSAGP
ncbi:MAG: xylose isomerase, partial [Segetibacter sp.]